MAVLGYGAQGRAQAIMLQKSGSIGDCWTSGKWSKCSESKEDGLPVLSFAEAAQAGDILHILLPDEVQKEVYEQDVLPF